MTSSTLKIRYANFVRSGYVIGAVLLTILLSPKCMAQAASDSSQKVKLTDATWKEVQQVISEQQGKVVVVDFWSTGCPPCMKEFPNLVKLQQKHPKEVVCISFNIDYAGIKSKPPEFYRPRVEKFLASRKATIRNFMSSTDSDQIYIDLKLNSIPAVFVYDRTGKLSKRFDDSLMKPGKDEAFNYAADINPYVEKLLK